VCERYTSGKSAGEKDSIVPAQDLFSVRNELTEKYIRNPECGGLRVGLPRASFMLEYLPFWAVFFNRLGCDVKISPVSNLEIFKKGLRLLSAETCLPVKMAFGHAAWLEESDVDFIFFPSLIGGSDRGDEWSQRLCPYTEHLPYMLRPILHKKKILTPCLDLKMDLREFKTKVADLQHVLGKSQGEISVAYREACAAQEDFLITMKRIGKKVLRQCLEQKKKVWLILGKPYNLHDSFINMNLNRHLKKIDVQALPIGFLPIEGDLQPGLIGIPPWIYNAQILKTAFWAKDKDNIFPLIISCYGCGPDAFTAKHLNRILVNKPHLFLEFDEHRAEAGLITRLEAFWDEISEYTPHRDKKRSNKKSPEEDKMSVKSYREKKFVLPYFADHAAAFSGAMRGIGMKTEVLPMPDEESVALGEDASSGKECHAYSIIAGDLIKFAKSKREGGEIYYFPGTKNLCLLSQYGEGMNYILQDLGINDLEVLAPPFDFMTGLLGIDGLTLLWNGLVSIDLLIKASCEKRPYELEKGMTDRIHKMNLVDIEEGLAKRSLAPALKRCAKRLKSIPIFLEERPLVGIAGDIYTRQHPVANHNLFLKLEELGCEVMPSPLFVDEVDFNVGKKLSRAINDLDLSRGAGAGLMHLRKEWQRRKIRKKLKGTVRSAHELGYKDVIKFTSRYLHQDNNEILLLNIAKMADFVAKGASGVINAICFNCMLGTVSEAIAARIQSDYNNIPIPTMIYSGTDIQVEKTKLEAFVFQVKNYNERYKKDRSFSRKSEVVVS
jgi:predicted nucleotide-binding protein (sugar kinase/HSP70/actin superfamily)